MLGAGVIANGQCDVGDSAPGHPHVEPLGGGAIIDEENGTTHGKALGLVDGHGVGQGHLVSDVVPGEHHPSPAAHVLHHQGVVALVSQHLPAVSVAHPTAP